MPILIELTKILNLTSIPVVIQEKKWIERFSNLSKPVATRASPKIIRPVAAKPILSTNVTRSGRQVAHRKLDADEVTDFIEDGEFSSPIKSKPRSQGLEIPEAVVTMPRDEAKHRELNKLLSVAEAFEKRQAPDASDVTSAAIEGTSTVKLVRECCLCHKRILGRNALGRHMKNYHPAILGPYKCPMMPNCAKVLENGTKVLRHLKTVHLDVLARKTEHKDVKRTLERGPFECNIQKEMRQDSCNSVFKTVRSFTEHMKREHCVRPWLCVECPDLRRFQDRQNYQYHLLTHQGQRDFVCDICLKSYATPRQLYSHRSLHLGKRFLCPHCGFRARSNANLRGHVRTKHEDRGFECEVCSKKFSSNTNLKNHQRIHTGETPFQCILCNVSFKRSHHLNAHLESKVHQDVLDDCRQKGVNIPSSLDPSKRRQLGRGKIEDGPVTNEPILIGTVPYDNMVILDENVRSFVMLDGQTTVEIVHAPVNLQ